MEKIKVFFIPFAGGSSIAYYQWKKNFPDNYEPHFIELAGRGARSGEQYYEDVNEAAIEISELITKEIGTGPYMIFGHSMGALIAFEVYYKLMELKTRAPLHIFFSGRVPPFIKLKDIKDYDKLDDFEFLKRISVFNGLPKEFYQKEVMKEFLPVLRSDFKIVENYTYTEKNEKIKCGFTVLYGEEDLTMKQKEIEGWKYHAGSSVNFQRYKGNHFFINDHYHKIINLMVRTTNTVLTK